MSDPTATFRPTSAGPPDTAAHSPGLLTLLEQYQADRAAGRVPRLADLCPDNPALLAELGRAVEQLGRFDIPRPMPVAGPPGYEVLDELGRGGMGVVYRVRHRPLDRVVALKVILAGGHASAWQRDRFLAEARAVARLRHPNVVQVYEVGEHAGLPYFTLEYVPGGSLEAHAAGPLAPSAAAALVERIARGVAHAHAAGLIHRDLKLANVLLEPDGTPKVCDFGLAKLTDDADGPTATGAILGTPAYMAPEQAAGQAKRVGPAADVWALGGVLYRLLTGRPPFQGATPWATLELVKGAVVSPPSKLAAGLPAGLDAVCLKCLRREPGDRYDSAAAVADDLARWLRGEPVTARPRPPWWRRYRLTVRIQLVAVALLVGLLALSTFRRTVQKWTKEFFGPETNETANPWAGDKP